MDAPPCFQVCFGYGIRGLWRPSYWPRGDFVDVPGLLVLVVNWEQLLFLYGWEDAEKLWDTSRIWTMLIDEHQANVITVRCSVHVTVFVFFSCSNIGFPKDEPL